MAKWFLNAALTAWRAEVNKQFPKRDKQSDGTVGDLAHQASVSQHNPDGDGSVDAWDMDVDLDGTNNDKGPAEAIEKLKLAFQRDPRSQLWIHDGQIANRDVDNWRRRKYTGANSHSRHIHWQTRETGERKGTKWGLDSILDASNVPASSGKQTIGSRTLKHGMRGPDVAYLQRWLGVKPDSGFFGDLTEAAVRRYQRDHKLVVDGRAGAATFKAMGVKK